MIDIKSIAHKIAQFLSSSHEAWNFIQARGVCEQDERTTFQSQFESILADKVQKILDEELLFKELTDPLDMTARQMIAHLETSAIRSAEDFQEHLVADGRKSAIEYFEQATELLEQARSVEYLAEDTFDSLNGE